MCENKNVKLKKDISGRTLKIIAMVAMLIDHIAAGGIIYYVRHNNIVVSKQLKLVYEIMRDIGRLAFPIYIFLLVEGLKYTRNKWKYLLRMIVFAFISEIPFDLAIHTRRLDLSKHQLFELGGQNVYFTLAIGLFVIIIIDEIRQRSSDNLEITVILGSGVTACGMLLAKLLHTDYRYVGVLAIVVMYALRYLKLSGFIATVLTLLWSSYSEAYALFDIPLIMKYEGRKGFSAKYLFYAFYPAHLLIIGLVNIFLL